MEQRFFLTKIFTQLILKMNSGQLIVLLVTLHRYCSANKTLSPAQYGLINFVNKFAYSYNPHVGYEPYWADGDRVLHDESVIIMSPHGSTNPPTTIKISLTKSQKVCGEECFEGYRSIKHVCTHHTGNNQMKGCMYHPLSDDSWKQHCWNVKPDTFVDPFTEFDTYCEFLQATCLSHFTTPKYILLHIGKCKDEHFWFKDLSHNSKVLQRMTEYPLLDENTPGFDLSKKGKRRRRTTRNPSK